ncbi:methyl-accepting chemotaxis protein [Geomonas subterranea]|uniref:Methyl-accepting chemotaxis protein n=1 Tax=Geomonas subterranea TaxID=2847989 RepID=A0ABX8LAV8_9BACT|nr:MULTISPECIES: HAMP domain-containing methyl-accepting chemotaxis protein [Geomonas]QXE89118.1 methyl-accepting chemotaxis protein [Geomonas subterranea]QXM08764.1 methyl-accepting chemotaxis protein [Geomonas subterranea]
MKDLTLRTRLIGSFLIMALLVAFTGGFGALNIKRVGGQIQNILEQLSKQQKLVLLMGVTQKYCHVSLMQAALVPNDPEKLQEYIEDYQMKRDTLLSQAQIILDGNKKLGVLPVAKGSVIEKRTRQFLVSWAEFEKVADELIARKQTLMKGVPAGVMSQAAKDALADQRLNQLANEEIATANDKAKEDLDDILVEVGNRMTDANKQVSAIQQSAGITFTLVIVVAAALAVALGLLITRNIVSRVRVMAEAVNSGADGDLTARVEMGSHDEIGKLGSDFNEMVGRLSGMIGKVSRSSNELAGISDTMAKASHSVVGSAKTQAESVSKTSAAIVQINTSVKGVAQGVDSLSISASESSSSILEMASSVEEVVQNMENLALSVNEVSSSIVEMGASIKQVGNGVVSLMEVSTATASSVMEMDSSIKQVERNANETAAISKAVRIDAETGREAVDAMITGMQEIKRASLITSEVIATLSERAADIGDILSVIDEVAEQTNLLALNAAIIAAQAGEHGKGFAVVADEIKELSERTSVSTREISQVIRAVQDETHRAVDAIDQAERSIADGELLSQKSGEALTKIVVGVTEATAQVTEIARTTVEQAKGSQMIREAMEQVSEMVAQIAKATREQGQGSELIMAAVENMKSLTSQVLSSTREQNKVGNLIAQSTESITEMIRHIKRACDEQSRGSEQIVRSVEDIQEATDANLEATRVMDEAVYKLFRQTEMLKQEMEAFKI